jgi:hypothetical protein
MGATHYANQAEVDIPENNKFNRMLAASVLFVGTKGTIDVFPLLKANTNDKDDTGNDCPKGDTEYVENQEELLEAAEEAAGGDLDDFNNYKPDWWKSPDGNRKIEWNPDGHANTNEGPHVTVRDFNGRRHSVTKKIFIKGRRTYRRTYK